MVVIQELADTPTVRFQPCGAYLAELWASPCSECGWLEEDH
jgi:hypothetical protein